MGERSAVAETGSETKALQLATSVASAGQLQVVDDVPGAIRPVVASEQLAWRNLRNDEFWRNIEAWRDVSAEQFLDHRWQERNAVTCAADLLALLGARLAPAFAADLELGMRQSPMSVRISPYILALVDWDDPVEDPLRRQFLPLASQLEEDHPLVGLDTLAERADSPVRGLTHRYFDRVLFLTTDQCPVYCRYCTRSYAVGLDTEGVNKVNYPVSPARWERVFEYVSQRPEIEDVVISGGDTYRLKPDQLRQVGLRLLNIEHVRRIRFATKGLAVQPMRILSDAPWTDALTEVAHEGRRRHKDVAVHTHFNHPREITAITQQALNLLFERAIPVRNLTVTLRGVNNDAATQIELIKRLSLLNVRPYYTYMGDMVRGTDDLRTAVAEAMQIEKSVRGASSGHNTPTYVLDAPHGGGKRNLYSFEHYDRQSGISVYAAPSVKADQLFVYGDPLFYLSPEMRQLWRHPESRKQMIGDALSTARRGT